MKHVDTLLLPLLFSTTALAQTGNYSLSASSALKVVNAGPADELLVVERRFGFDSAYVELLHADAEWTSTALASYRFNAGLYFLFDAARLTSGTLVSGLFPTPGASSLLLLNDDGSIAWSKTVSGMQGSQRRFPKVFAEGDDLVAYSNTDGFFSDLFYRLEGDATGTTWSAMEISTNDDVPQRFYDGVATATPGEHILVGSRVNSAEAQILMARIHSSGVVWMKQYDLNSPETQFEEAVDAIMLDNGDFACVMTARETASTTAAFVMRFQGDGSPVWTTKLTEGSGHFGSALTELADGSILVAASAATQPRVIRLASNGDLLWATACTTCSGGLGSFVRTGSGALIGHNGGTIFEFTEEGQACDFTPTNTVTAAPFTPVVTALVASSTPVTLTAGDVPMFTRVPVNALAQGCVFNSVQERAGTTELQAYPTPTRDIVRLAGVGSGEPFVLRGMDGRTISTGAYRDGIDLSALPAGPYMVEMLKSRARARVMRE